MALPDAVVRRIFIRMTLRYGAAWIATLKGEDGEETRIEWARELTGTSLAAIEYALENLPDGPPPQLEQFKGLCVFGASGRQARRDAGDASVVAAALSKMQRTRTKLEPGRHPLQWAYDLRDRERRGEHLSDAARASWRAVLGDEQGGST